MSKFLHVWFLAVMAKGNTKNFASTLLEKAPLLISFAHLLRHILLQNFDLALRNFHTVMIHHSIKVLSLMIHPLSHAKTTDG